MEQEPPRHQEQPRQTTSVRLRVASSRTGPPVAAAAARPPATPHVSSARPPRLPVRAPVAQRDFLRRASGLMPARPADGVPQEAGSGTGAVVVATRRAP